MATSHEALKALGNDAFKGKRFEEAVRHYTAAIEAAGDTPVAPYYANRAAANLALRRMEEVVADGEAALKIDASYAKVHSRMGAALLDLGRLGDARSSFAKAGSRATEAVDAVEEAEKVLGGYGTFGARGSSGEAKTESKGDDTGIVVEGAPGYAAAEQALRKLDAGAKQLSAVSAAVERARARCLLRLARYDAVAAVDRELFVEGPHRAWYASIVCVALAAKGDLDRLVSVADDLHQSYPGVGVLGRLAKAARKLKREKDAGNTLFKDKRLAAALAKYKETAAAARAGPFSLGVSTLESNQAAALASLDHKDEAHAAFTRAIAINPFSVRLLTRRAILARSMSRDEDALQDLKWAQWLDPASKDLPFQLFEVESRVRKDSKRPATAVISVDDDDDWPAVVARAKGRLIIADYFASWCGPCKQIAPVLANLSMSYSHVMFVKINGDKCTELAVEAGVSGFPTFHAYRDGKKVGELVGADPGQLQNLIVQHGGKHAHPHQSPAAFMKWPPQ